MTGAKHSVVHAAMEHRVTVRQMLWRLTRNRSDVDELLQETWARLVGVSSHPNPRALAMRTALNLAKDRLRTLRVTPEMTPLEEDIAGCDPLDHAVNAEMELREVVLAIQQLPVRDRAVFTLRKIYGYSIAEIMRHLSLSVGAVEEALTRALRQLSRLLGREVPSYENGHTRRVAT